MNALDEIELRGKRKGRREGEREGRRKGRREGRAQMLLQLMEARFGDVPADLAARVQAADETALDRWAVQVLTATTPEEVLDPAPARQPARKPSTRKRPARA